jgi:hypothetical protein
MTSPPEGEEPESLRELAGRVIDNTKAYVRAEVTLVKQTAVTKASQAAVPAALVVVAVLLLQAAITVLAAALGLFFARWLGSAGGLAVAALVVLAISGLLVWIAVNRIKRIAE